MKKEIKKYLLEFKNGTKLMFKEFFNKETNKKQRANMWTFIRLIIPMITLLSSIIAIITSSIPLFVGTGIIAGFGALTDFFDGKSARKYNSSSKYGKMLDQASDKFFAGIIGINLLFLNFNYIFVLLGEALIALINISYKLKNKDLDINSTLIGRIKEWPLFFTLALGYLSTINPTLLLLSNISIILTVICQLATAVSYIESNTKEVKEMKKNNIINIIEDLNNDDENENIKTKSIVGKNNKIVEESKKNSRLEQCENLRKLKNELISYETDTNQLGEKGYQKTKK